ncbi:MAG: hypothetical protein RSA27_02525, partial [Oscillospiraceae bacterium]
TKTLIKNEDGESCEMYGLSCDDGKILCAVRDISSKREAVENLLDYITKNDIEPWNLYSSVFAYINTHSVA